MSPCFIRAAQPGTSCTLTRNTCLAKTSQSSGEGAPRVETLVAPRFAYKAFRRSTTSSSLKPETLVEGFFRWFAYRLPSAIFVYHAPLGLREIVPPAFPQFSCLTSLKLCYTGNCTDIFSYIYVAVNFLFQVIFVFPLFQIH